MFTIELSSYAEEDIVQIFNWYNEQVSGLGTDFIQKADECFKAIAKNPEHFQIIENGIQRALLKKFPYVVFFEVWNEIVYIYGVIHTKRDPNTIKKRG